MPSDRPKKFTHNVIVYKTYTSIATIYKKNQKNNRENASINYTAIEINLDS